MVGTADVISKSGGADLLRNDGEIRVTITAAAGAVDTTSITSTLFNNNRANVLYLGTRFGRVTLPNGATSGDFWNVRVAPDSETVRIVKPTANADGHRNLLAALSPGAVGRFEWDGAEWHWSGAGAIWMPVLKNDPGAWTDIATAGDFKDFAPYEDSSGDNGAVIVRRDASGDLKIYCQSISDTGVNGARGSEITHSETNAINATDGRIHISSLDGLIFLVWFNEDTTSHTRVIVVTRTAGTTSLVASSTSTILINGIAAAQNVNLLPMRGHADRFIMNSATAIDAATVPEIAYCTISGTSATATVTRNTGVAFGGTNNANTDGPNCFEDRDLDGTFWLLTAGDDSGTNLNEHICKFTIVGTTPTIGGQWLLPSQGLNANKDKIVPVRAYGNMCVYRTNETGHMFYVDLSSGTPAIVGGVRSATNSIIDNADYTGYFSLTVAAGVFGGAIVNPPVYSSPGTVYVSYRLSKANALTGFHTGYFAYNSGHDAFPQTLVPEISSMTHGAPGQLPVEESADVFRYGMTQNRWPTEYGMTLDNEGINVMWQLETDESEDNLCRLAQFEVGLATLWKEVA